MAAIPSEAVTPTTSGPVRDVLAALDDERARGTPARAYERLREALTRAIADQHEAFLAGARASDIVRARAADVDAVLSWVWEASGLGPSGFALVAVGGYGRGELHPYSDVDIAILVTDTRAFDPEIERFLTALWDLGLEIGHSVRTVAETLEQAADVTVMTNLLEHRLVCGDAGLVDAVHAALAPDRLWSSAEFFEAKFDEQEHRHERFDDALQQLEPNVKESPGGLRDVQVIGWVAKRHFQNTDLRELVAHGFLTEDEFLSLVAGEEFLWRIRCHLHYMAGRREDRLLFDYQTRIAKAEGFLDDNRKQAVERFMHEFYKTVRKLSLLNDILLNLFNEAIIERQRPAEIRRINRRFQVRDNAIEVTHPRVFLRTPTALLEIFLLMQQDASIKAVRASTIRAIQEHLYLIDDDFRADIRARSLFMEIMRQPRRVGHELARMHKYGVLPQYLPSFAAVTGLMQFDLFHIYTVDEHTLFVIRNIRRLLFPHDEHDQPRLTRSVIEHIPKLEILYLAGLFHDIAKGRGGDHSELGEAEAKRFCDDHGFSTFDSNLVGWLVKNHLKMSITVQRQDIYDPEVINEFAAFVGDRMHLDYLFLLTVADIRGTNPKLWTSWKETLLSDLYTSTLRALRRSDGDPFDQAERIEATHLAALKLLHELSVDIHAVRELWRTFQDDYFLRYRPEEIAWQSSVITARAPHEEFVVDVREFPDRGLTAAFVYCEDRSGLFATTTRVLDRLGLDVTDARIMTLTDGYTLDTYILLEEDSGEMVRGEARRNEIRAALEAALRTGTIPNQRLSVGQRRVRAFSVPTTIDFSPDDKTGLTRLSIVTADRQGLLSLIGQAMHAAGIRLHNARVATFGERVEDFFYISDDDGEPFDDPARQRAFVEAFEQLRGTSS